MWIFNFLYNLNMEKVEVRAVPALKFAFKCIYVSLAMVKVLLGESKMITLGIYVQDLSNSLG